MTEKLAEAEKQVRRRRETDRGCWSVNWACGGKTLQRHPSPFLRWTGGRTTGSEAARGKRAAGNREGSQPDAIAGRWRELVPAERVNEVIEVFPPRCRHCNHRFPGRGPQPAIEGEPRRHQVTELAAHPKRISPSTRNCQRALCPECGKATQAAIPKEAAGNFGPQLTSAHRFT